MYTEWSKGYYVGSAYTGGFYPEHTPVSMAWAALVSGTAPPPHEGAFTYLELGCGFGETALAVAAAHPKARVVAMDMNPDHVVAVRDKASALGLDNVEVYDESFAEFQHDLRADYVASHGVISWVTDQVRQDFTAMLDRTTNAGGLVYISYNAMPGRAAARVLQRLIVDRLQHETGTDLQRLEKAMSFAGRVAENSYFFKNHQTVARYLDQTKKRPVAYLAHEFINGAWDPLWFEDVARLLEGARLSWVGAADSVRSVGSLSTPRSLRPMLEAIPDRLHRQTVRDVLLDTGFRRDLFGRGRRSMPPGGQRRRVLQTRFCLAEPRDQCKLDVVVPAGEIRLHDEPYEAILDALAEGPRTGFSMVGPVDEDAEQIFIGMLVLVAVGYAKPCLTVVPDPEREQSIRDVNLRAASQIDDEAVRLVSPLTGHGRRLGRFDALILRGVMEGREDIPRFAAHALHEAGQQLILDDMPVVDPEELVPEFRKLETRFHERIRPLLELDGML